MHARIVAIALCLVALGTGGGASASRPLRVLFIGNSLTYVNDLPAMFGRIAELDGRQVLTVTMAFPDYSLEDHLQSKKTMAALEEDWDVVVLQQGPSSLDDSRSALIRDAKVLRARIGQGTRMALLMVWPDRSRWHAIPRVAETYRLGAKAVDGEFIPAGLGWAAALEKDASIPLFSADAFHPAPDGTYLAALTTYRVLVGIPPRRATTPTGAHQVAGKAFASTNAQLSILVAASERAVREHLDD